MKGIIVLDEVPKTCQHIRGNEEDGCPFGGMVCQICNTDVMEHVKNGTKPDWCPIHMLPDKLKSDIESAREDFDYVCGWNACLHEIEGKMRYGTMLRNVQIPPHRRIR